MNRTFAIVAVFALAACGGDKKAASPQTEPTPEAAAKLDDFWTLDFDALPEAYPEALKIMRASQKWDLHTKDSKGGKGDPRQTLELKMNKDLLEQSFGLGQQYLINWQLPEGNFRYMYDWMDKTWVNDDHQVRQAGSLWGIATCYRYRPSPEAKAALDKGLKFWFDKTKPGPREGTLLMSYPGARKLDSGTVALVSLALVEYLKTEAPLDPAWKAELEAKLDGYLKFLQYLQRDNGLIAKDYDLKSEKKSNRSSPYYCGESLLAMTKAARQLGKEDLIPTIERAARAMAEEYTVKSWKKKRKGDRYDRDSNTTKGFFQWGSMSFDEYHQAKWKDHEMMGDVALTLGWWMTHTHATLKKRRNHAYAVEGLLAGWHIANRKSDIPAQTDLLFTLDRSLHKLGGWQIGGPLASTNSWLGDQGKDDEMAVGGVMNARKPSGTNVKKDVSHQLRIDVTQHQMHATTMALEYIYADLAK